MIPISQIAIPTAGIAAAATHLMLFVAAFAAQNTSNTVVIAKRDAAPFQ